MLDVLESLAYLFAFVWRGLKGIFGPRDNSLYGASDVVAGVFVVIIALLAVAGLVIAVVG